MKFSTEREVSHITSGLPVSVPPSGGFLEDLDCSLVLGAVRGQLNLSLFQLRLVLPLLLAHDHVPLGQISLDAQAILFISITGLRGHQPAPLQNE